MSAPRPFGLRSGNIDIALAEAALAIPRRAERQDKHRRDERMIARTLSIVMIVGASCGVLITAVPGLGVTEQPMRGIYLATMVAVIVMGLVAWQIPRMRGRWAFGWLLAGHLAFFVSGMAAIHLQGYVTALPLVFGAAVAGWYLTKTQLRFYMLIMAVAILPTALPFHDPMMVAIQWSLASTLLASLAWVTREIRTRQEHLAEELERLSLTDPLTGLPNRRYLTQQAASLWSRADTHDQKVAALVLDLDRFKRVNDELGHSMGDKVLKAVANAIGSSLRSGDLVARTGGEEIVVLTTVRTTDDALVLSERLRAAVAAIDAPVRCTVSVGVAVSVTSTVADPLEAVWQVIESADGAMYQAKNAGRNRSVLVEHSATINLSDLPAIRPVN